MNRNNNSPPQAKKSDFILQNGLSKLFPEVFQAQLKPKSEKNYQGINNDPPPLRENPDRTFPEY